MPDIFKKKQGASQVKARVIVDPIRDAEQKYGKSFLVQRKIDPWKRKASFCTTGQFGKLEEGFVRHCGPTAITNAIVSINRKYHVLKNPKRDPNQKTVGVSYYFPAPQLIFQTVAKIGKKNGYYWNMDVWKRFGGTYDIAMKRYLEKCFAHFEISCRIYGKYPTVDEDFVNALRHESLLYLQLMKHPVYGNHHVICYGCVELASIDSEIHKMYLIIADGWSREVRYLDTDELMMCHFYEVSL